MTAPAVAEKGRIPEPYGTPRRIAHAFLFGYWGAAHGLRVTDNRYAPGTEKWKAWRAGFVAQREGE